MANEEISFKLGLDAKSFQRALTGVKSQLNDLATEKWSAFKSALGVGAAAAGLRAMGEEMVALRRSAEDVGASIGFVKTLQSLSEKFGGTAEDANAAMTKLAESIGAARTEGGAAEEKFKRFGIALYDANGNARDTGEVFKAIAEAYKGSSDAATKAALAFEFFGRTGRNINNILGEGAEGIEAYKKTLLGIDVDLRDGDVRAVADAWQALKDTVVGAKDAVTGFVGRTVDGLGAVFRLLGSLSSGSNPMEAWNQEMDFWRNRDRPEANGGTGAGDIAAQQQAQAKAIEALSKARSDSAAAQMTDEGKLAQVAKDRAAIEAKMRAEAPGSLEYLKLENELLQKGYDARKLQADIAAKLAEREKLDQKLDAAANQFAILQLSREELETRRKIASLKDGSPERVRLEKQHGELVAKRAKLEHDAQRLELQQMLEREKGLAAEIGKLEGVKGRELEMEKKVEEQKKAQLEIAKKAQDIERGKLDLLQQQAEAGRDAANANKTLADAKAERFRFSLKELADADPRGFRGETRKDIFGAREVSRLEAQAMWQNLHGTAAERDRLQGLADQRRQQIGLLRADEKFPFKAMEEAQKEAAKNLRELNAAAKGAGIPVIPKFG